GAGDDVLTTGRVHVLRGGVALEDVLEVARERVVDVEEVRHVDDVVDDLTAVGALDAQALPAPVRPLVGAVTGDLRDGDVLRRRVALRVVPDVQLAVALEGRPGAGLRDRRDAPGVGD